jgi:hypothetical protein
MSHRQFPTSRRQHATTDALDIFVEGCRIDNVRNHLSGVAALSDATEGQLYAAMSSVEASQHVTRLKLLRCSRDKPCHLPMIA